MKNIAVVCALPPGRNTGMATVDLAAQAYFERTFPDATATLFAYGSPTKHAYQEGDLPFRHHNIVENAEAYHASDMFVFWGDFIHSRSYLKYDRGAWDTPDGVAPGPAADKVIDSGGGAYARHIFLSGSPDDVIARSVVFGSTIITNDAVDQLDLGYKATHDHLFRNLGAVMFRDALSAAKIAPLRGQQATLGCDPAFLLNDADLTRLPGFKMASERKGVGVFFGRSASKGKMLGLSRYIANRLGEQCRWIPWFWSGRRVRWPARMFGYKVPARDVSTGELLSALSGFRYIVTDTYHLCVNAWRLGIPAICIGQGAGASANSLSDKKKEILYEMYGARSLYVFSESLGLMSGLAATGRRVADAIADRRLTDQIRANVADHRRMAEHNLACHIRRGLESTADRNSFENISSMVQPGAYRVAARPVTA